MGSFSLQSELGEWEEKLSKGLKTPFNRPVRATCCSACCLCAFVAKRIPGVGEDVAPWAAGFQGKARGLWLPAWGAPATGRGAVQGRVFSEGKVLDERLHGDVVPLCKEDMG